MVHAPALRSIEIFLMSLKIAINRRLGARRQYVVGEIGAGVLHGRIEKELEHPISDVVMVLYIALSARTRIELLNMALCYIARAHDSHQQARVAVAQDLQRSEENVHEISKRALVKGDGARGVALAESELRPKKEPPGEPRIVHPHYDRWAQVPRSTVVLVAPMIDQ